MNLTDAQKTEVLQLKKAGATNNQVAQKLFRLGVKTAKSGQPLKNVHLSKIYKDLGISSGRRANATKAASNKAEPRTENRDVNIITHYIKTHKWNDADRFALAKAIFEQ